jgi:UDP-N-acetylglucosamine--dolichyl-phosphate N-acetylglucosaminephosphotransferase
MSVAKAKKGEVHPLGRLILKIFQLFKLARVVEGDEGEVEVNNLTLINLMLLWKGPTHEEALTRTLLLVQIFGTLVAFTIRYPLASVFYDV